MTALLRAEWRKFVSTSLPIVLIVVGIGLTAMNVVALSLAAGQPGVPPLSDPSAVRNVYGSAGQSAVIALVLGILSMTGENRWQTITATFIAEPRRGRVVAAKMVISAFVGLLLGVINAVVLAALALPLLAWRDAIAIPTSDIAGILIAVPAAYAMYAVVGVGFGALVRNQIAALVSALLWVMLVEALVVAFAPAVGKWLPGGAVSGMLRATGYTGGSYLPPALATVVLLGYAAAFALAATATTLRRDVT